MKFLVIYDSVFGNTEKIALAMGDALTAAGGEGSTLPVGQAEPARLTGLDLLVIGSPTRGFRPTEGMTAFIDLLQGADLTGLKAAAFDTRIDLATIGSAPLRFIVNTGGYAANTIAKTLKKKGVTVVAAEGFLVTGEQGPLKDGELERAAAWTEKL